MGVWAYLNDGALTVDISTNAINANTGYTTLPFGIGILAQQTSNASPTVLYTNFNTIKYLKSGIKIEQFKNAVCGGNLIDNITQVASNSFASGIFLANCPNSSITSNTARSSSTNWWHTGIRNDEGPGTTMSCNKVQNIGFGFQIGGTQTGTKFFNNLMINNEVGLGIAYTSLGSQSLIANIDQPSDNKWSGYMGAHTKSDYSNTLPNFSKLNVRTGSQGVTYYDANALVNYNLYPNNMINISNPSGIFYNPIFINQAAGSQPPCSAPAPLMASGNSTSSGNTPEAIEPEIALEIIGAEGTGSLYEESKQWLEKYNLYSYLQNDTIISNDTIIIAFEDSARNANLGIIEKTDLLLGDLKDVTASDLASQLDEINNIVPDNAIEEKMQEMQIKELEQIISNSGFTTPDILEMQNLATQCPFEKGAAVYKARIILAGLEGANKSYSNACERISANNSSNRKAYFENLQSTSVSSFAIYPNPATDFIYLSIESEGTYSGIFEIYDLLGKRVISQPINSLTVQISTEIINNGVFYYIMKVDSNTISEGKLVITK